MPAATDITAAAAKIRNHLLKASLPIFLLSIACPAQQRHRRKAQGTGPSGHVDNPEDRVKFRRLD
jgi:hypothetical protein